MYLNEEEEDCYLIVVLSISLCDLFRYIKLFVPIIKKCQTYVFKVNFGHVIEKANINFICTVSIPPMNTSLTYFYMYLTYLALFTNIIRPEFYEK